VRENLGINRVQTEEQETSEYYYWRKVKYYSPKSHQAVLLVLMLQLGW